jgi:hypothetical protein
MINLQTKEKLISPEKKFPSVQMVFEIAQQSTRARPLAVRPEDNDHVFEGQADFETHCTALDCTFLEEIPRYRESFRVCLYTFWT